MRSIALSSILLLLSCGVLPPDRPPVDPEQIKAGQRMHVLMERNDLHVERINDGAQDILARLNKIAETMKEARTLPIFKKGETQWKLLQMEFDSFDKSLSALRQKDWGGSGGRNLRLLLDACERCHKKFDHD